MIISKFIKLKNKFVGFQISGHSSNIDKNKLICSNVSCIVYGNLNVISHYLKDETNISILEDKIQVKILKTSYLSQTLINSLYIQLLTVEQKDKKKNLLIQIFEK